MKPISDEIKKLSLSSISKSLKDMYYEDKRLDQHVNKIIIPKESSKKIIIPKGFKTNNIPTIHMKTELTPISETDKIRKLKEQLDSITNQNIELMKEVDACVKKIQKLEDEKIVVKKCRFCKTTTYYKVGEIKCKNCEKEI